MSDTRERAWRFYLDDMLGFAEKVLFYSKGLVTLLTALREQP